MAAALLADVDWLVIGEIGPLELYRDEVLRLRWSH